MEVGTKRSRGGGTTSPRIGGAGGRVEEEEERIECSERHFLTTAHDVWALQRRVVNRNCR